MKRELLTLSFDGTAYHGWQVQPNGITVQETVQDSLFKILGTRPALTGCSRTDAGVHARMFCCHFDCEDKIPEAAFTKGLDSVLPRDIAVLDCREVPRDFHARYSAKGKSYVYRFFNASVRDPFALRYALRVTRPVNLEAVNKFCAGIVGKHDFAAFSAAARTAETTVRTVSECYAERAGDTVLLHISADGFLYNMVRIIAGTALGVSDGAIAPDAAAIISSGKRESAGITLPPQGLTLEKVFY